MCMKLVRNMKLVLQKSKQGDVLKHASDAGDAGDAGYLLKTYNQPCNSLLMSALYETMNSDAGKY